MAVRMSSRTAGTLRADLAKGELDEDIELKDYTLRSTAHDGERIGGVRFS
jgi:hypothetical protein